MEGLCRYESLKDGSLGLEDVALLNDAITVRNINEDKYRNWCRENREK